jgi:hypothetical protein
MTLHAAVSSGGVAAAGNAVSVEHLSGTNEYRIDFTRSLSGCVYSAVLAAVQAGATLEQPEAGESPSRPTGHVCLCGPSEQRATPSSSRST